MDFLRRHFEKVLLGVFLFGFLASCYYLLHSLGTASSKVEDVKQKADDALLEQRPLELLEEERFDAVRMLTDPRITVNIAEAAAL